MKKRLLVFLFILSILLFPIVLSHGAEEDEFVLDHSKLYPINQLEAVGYGSLIFGILILIIVIFHKKMNNTIKKNSYFLVVAVSLLVTLYLVITTLHLNIISITKGPVHWHADFEIWVCDKKIELAEPKGLSNKQGVDLMHAHNDDRIHVEGVLLDEKQASLGAFFHAIGGSLSDDGITVPTDNGLIAFHEGDKCNEKPSKLYVFVNENLLSSPSSYVISPYEDVPPGDRIKFVFTEKAIEEINPHIKTDKNVNMDEHESTVLPPKQSLCDINRDSECDENDINLFQASLGSCRGDSNYNVMADSNVDGCVTEGDEKILFRNKE